jgi:hypothetical protein
MSRYSTAAHIRRTRVTAGPPLSLGGSSLYATLTVLGMSDVRGAEGRSSPRLGA